MKSKVLSKLLIISVTILAIFGMVVLYTDVLGPDSQVAMVASIANQATMTKENTTVSNKTEGSTEDVEATTTTEATTSEDTTIKDTVSDAATTKDTASETATSDTATSETTTTKDTASEGTASDTVEAEQLKVYNVNLAGVKVNSYDTMANVSGNKITNLAFFKRQLKRLPKLVYVDMCDCGLTNEQMEGLQKEFPNIMFAWRLDLGLWSVRTDALAFSTLHAWATDPRLQNNLAQQLKYCTELTALDLGHNSVGDIDFIKNMPDLRILIMVDNYNTDGTRFNDLSVLKYTPKLKYLEFFVGGVTDLSFLKYTPEIWDLNISYNPISDATYLKDLPNIQRLFLESTQIPYSEFEELQTLYPNAQLEYYGSGSIDHGWRGKDRYWAMIDMYHKDYLDDLFLTEEELNDVKSHKIIYLYGQRYFYSEDTTPVHKRSEMAGRIKYSVESNIIPTKEACSNFGCIGNGYTIDTRSGAIKVLMDDGQYHWFYKSMKRADQQNAKYAEEHKNDKN